MMCSEIIKRFYLYLRQNGCLSFVYISLYLIYSNKILQGQNVQLLLQLFMQIVLKYVRNKGVTLPLQLKATN
jgi:hypothetical protein